MQASKRFGLLLLAVLAVVLWMGRPKGDPDLRPALDHRTDAENGAMGATSPIDGPAEERLRDAGHRTPVVEEIPEDRRRPGRIVSADGRPLPGLADAVVRLLDRAPRPERDKGTGMQDFATPAGAEEEITDWAKQMARAFRDGDTGTEVPVHGDGTFLAGLPGDLERAWPVLDHDVLYQTAWPELDPDGETTLLAAVGGRVVGRVTGPDGFPVGGAKVRGVRRFNPMDFVFGDPPEFRHLAATTGPDGRFAVRGVPPGDDLSLRADPPEGSSLSGAHVPDIVVAPGRTATVQIRLPAAAGLTGLILDVDREPIAGMDIKIEPEVTVTQAMQGADRSETVTTDEDGSFASSGLRPGTHTLIARRDGRRELRSGPWILAAGQVLDLGELVLDAGLSVAGRVVDKADKSPVAGATVEARIPVAGAGGFGLGDLASTPAGETVTGPDGSFVIGGLEEGAEVTLAARTDTAKGKAKGVAAGRTDVEIRITATGSVSGTVTDTDGAPVPTFEVTLAGAWGIAQRSETHVDGAFEFGGLGKGRTTLSFAAEGFAPHREARIKVLSGETTAINVVMSRAAVLGGVVLEDATGKPVTGARVRPGTGIEAFVASLMGGSGDRTRTGTDGRFSLGGLPSPTASLTVDHSDYAPLEVEEIATQAGGERLDLELRLTRGGAVEGLVLRDSGAPQAGSMVQVSKPFGTGVRTDMTDSSGRFAVAGLVPDTYQVVAIDMDTDARELAENVLNQMKMTTVTVVDGETAWVELGGPEDGAGASVEGTVRSGGAALAGVMVATAGGETGLESMRMATTDKEGRYQLRHLPPGTHTVSFSRPNMMGTVGGVTMRDVTIHPGDTRVTLDVALAQGSLGGRVVAADDGSPLGGIRVATRRRGSEIGVMTVASDGEAISAADGTWTIANLQPGTYDVTAGGAMFPGLSTADFAAVTLSAIEVKAGAVEGLDFRLPPAVAVAGRVVTRAGEGIEGAALFFRRPGRSEAFLDAFTSRSGSFRYEGLEAGTWQLVVTAAGHARWEQSFTFGQGEERVIEVVLDPGVTLIVDAGGLPGVRSVLRDRAGRVVSGDMGIDALTSFITGDSATVGTYPPGDYTLEVGAPGHRTSTLDVQLSGTGTRTITVTLKRVDG